MTIGKLPTVRGACLPSKRETSVTKAETEKKPNRLAEYFREARAEMRKVTWPTREEAINLTGIVLAVTVVMSILMWMLDLLFGTIVRALIG